MHTRARLTLCLGLCLLPFLPIAVRLVHLQILRHEDLSSRAESSIQRRLIEIIPRGRIVDREGRVLAQSLQAWSAFLDLKAFREDGGPSDGSVAKIAGALSLNPKEIRSSLGSRSRTVWLKRKMSYEEASKVKELGFRSIGIVMDEKRFYPNGELARPVIGDVNSAGRGSAGLEYSFNSELSGRAVRWELTRDGSGNAILRDPDRVFERPPDLSLTLDRTMQFFAEEALAATVRLHEAERGMILVQEVHTGEILVMASYPSDPYHNPAVQDVYEPGSTFKVVTAAAAVETGALGPGEKVDCENGKWQLTSEIRIKDHEPHGLLTLKEIIQHSSNIGTGKIGLLMGAKTLTDYATRFGFGYKTGVPLPAESPGIMKAPKGMNQVRLANASFGQGVAVTALQLLCAYSTIANGGTLLEPRLVRSIGESGERGAVVVRRSVRPETADELKRFLETVVREGTGENARVPGYAIAGKTGTAQKVNPKTGLYSEDDFVASFAGYFPATKPVYSALVVIDSPRKGGHYGSQVAAPLFKKMVRHILTLKGIPPESPLPLLVDPARPARPARPEATAPAPARPPVPSPAVRPLPRPSLLRALPDSQAGGSLG